MSLEVIYRIALAPAVLASIYRDMTLLKGKIAESTLLGTPKGIHDGLTVKLWSSMQLVHKVENVSLGLDSDKESFSSGKLGFPQVLWRKRNVGRRLLVLV
ncbi:hypothetical protein NC653_004300 [Populus alba x Populus x berolinensis]|uniref:Uncharacterized protein n=1 Tax=Populus alba x Populus x berolinensis TaxID=444605 RepID=A0AAD6WKC5_9ROSI|nr:hypothetical protein NC653_004300 [Populus alba x Populus x berolinensis]